MVKKQKTKELELKNAAKLSKTALKALIQDFQRLEGLSADVSEKLIRYIVDGTDEEVLLSVGNLKDVEKTYLLAFSKFQHWELTLKIRGDRIPFLFPKEKVAVEFFVRLGEVYEAIARTNTKHKIQLPEGWPLWLVVLLRELIVLFNTTRYADKQLPKWDVQRFRELFHAGELPSGQLVHLALNQNLQHAVLGSYYYYRSQLLELSTGWKEYLQSHVDEIRSAFDEISSETQRAYAIGFLEDTDFDFAPILDSMSDSATSTTKSLRETALPVLERHKDQARPHLEKLLREGPAGVREQAINVLWHLYAKDAEETLRNHLENEKSDKLKQHIERLLAAPTGGEPIDFGLPPVQVETGKIDLPKAAKDAIQEMFERADQQALRSYESDLERRNDPDAPDWIKNQPKPTKPTAMKEKTLKELIEFVEGKSDLSTKTRDELARYPYKSTLNADALAPPKVKLIHVARLAWALGYLLEQERHYGNNWYNRQELEAYRARCEEKFGLRELDAVVATLPGGEPGRMAREYVLSNTSWMSFCDWEAEAIWPAFAENLELLQELISPTSTQRNHYYYNRADQRRLAFKILGYFPQLPPQFIPVLWPIALGQAKTERPLAQEALETVEGKLDQIILTLKDSKPVVRAAAAEWLGHIGDASAIEPLKEAFRNETNEVTKGEIMWALENLEADINEFLDRDKLLDEAKAGLKKKKADPSDLEYLPLKEMPRIHWEDTGEEVSPEILKWWLIQCIQFKSASCSPLMQRYLDLCRRHETEQLTRFVLTHWLVEDTKSSASSGKGLLAIVSACGDLQCAKMCEQHIKKFGGQKMSQCRALMEALSWIDHPQAIQVLLGFANRFRTASLRKAASDHVHELAERQGWTLDELGDRTIPDGGFARPKDENDEPIGDEAKLVLDYGERKFTVTLNDELQPTITNEDGKTLKNPPSPGKNDDEEKAKAAKKMYSDAKKTVKEVVKRQTERFYEGLCTQRSWNFEDWQRYLAGHPIVGKICVRLVWAAFEVKKPKKKGAEPTEKLLGCFRPLEDGSLTDENDEEVKFDEGATIRLAHTCTVSKKVAKTWSTHLEEYDVTPLFDQFGQDAFELPKDKKKETAINDFEGYMITTFQLRGKATKLGYIRGGAGDGGSFYEYTKPFPSLGVQAVVEFTGSYLPEEDIPAALQSLSFEKYSEGGQAGYSYNEKLPLSKIPPVLLSECYNDMKQIAAAGSGHDKEWQKKSYF
ncbi:MAG: DUF4132 domain-containing protein [Gemmataceae bacterium]